MIDEQSNNPSPKANSLPVKPQRTILLIEDSEIDRAVYKRYLQKDSTYEYTFVEAETGEIALQIYLQSQPDLILLDYLLPDVDGLEWLNLWQQEYSNCLCPVIILTGQGDENIAVQFIKSGAADYFVKEQITSEKLTLAVNREISLQRLKQEKQSFTEIIQSQNTQLQETNQLLQNQIERCEISTRLIRSSEEKLHRAIFNAPIPIIIHAEDGEILQINQTWMELTGYSPEEIPTINDWLEKAYGSKQQSVKLEIDRLYQLNQRVNEGEFEVTTASGETRIWDFSSAPLGKLLDGRRLVISTARDVTEIKQAKIALEKSESKFRSTFEQAAVGMAHVALDGKWLLVNQKLCQILGYTKKKLLQKNFQEITYPEDLAPDLQYVRQILAGEITTYSIDKRYVCQDNSLIWINLTVSLFKNVAEEPEYFICVIKDIRDRKELELSQQKILQRLSNLHQIDRAIIEAQKPKAIANIALSGIWQLFTCEQISLVTFNFEHRSAKILVTESKAKDSVKNGLEMSLDIWQDLIDLVQNSEQDYIITDLSQLPRLSLAIPVLANSKLNHLICFPLKVQNQLLGIIKLWVKDVAAITSEELSIIKEITLQVAIALQQANLTKAIQNYAADLEQKVAERTSQLAEINQELKAFSYSISHDLKAPLRAIQGFATALQEDYAADLDDLGREYTERLAASAQQMEKLIQDLLTYSRLSRREIHKTSVNLNLAINQSLEDLATEIAAVQAQITVEAPLLKMLGNKTVLLQVISNILSNALKFVPHNVQPQIRIWTEKKANNVRLWIEDNGIGIEPQHQERIFQVFERLHGNESYPGTGIGLAIVKKGMERLEGKFGVESEINRGSRFWLELPEQ